MGLAITGEERIISTLWAIGSKVKAGGLYCEPRLMSRGLAI